MFSRKSTKIWQDKINNPERILQVLCIDDEQEFVNLTGQFLEKLSKGRIKPEIVTSAKQALTLLDKRSFDVVVSDYQMPEMSGLELLKELRMKGNFIPFIILTGHGREEVAIQALNLGADFYLQKNKNIEILFTELLHYIMISTEKKQVEVALRESERRFRTSIENMIDCFGIYSSIRDQSNRIVDFKVEYVNVAACENNRMSKEEQIGKMLLDILPAHLDTGLFDEYCEVVETGKRLMKGSFVYGDIYAGQYLVRTFDIRVTKLGDGFIAAWRDITELHQMQEDLRKSEEKYRNLVEQLPQSIVEIDKKGNLNFVNNNFLETFEYTHDDLKKGLNIIQFFPPEEHDKVKSLIQRWIIREKTGSYEFLGMKKDGTIFPIVFNSSRIMKKNIPIGLRGIIIDISSQKEAEERYRTIFDLSPDGIMLIDPETTRVVECNRTAHSQLNYSREEFVNLNIFDFEILNNPEEAKKHTKKTLKEGLREFETKYLTKTGEIRNMHIIAQSIELSGRTMIFSINRDITEHKQTEEALQESETLYRSFVQNLQSIAFQGDTNFIPIFFHGAVEAITGYTENEFGDQKLHWDQIIHSEDVLKFYKDAENVHTIPYYSSEREYRIIRKDGQIRWVQEQIQNICDPNGKPILVQGVIHDITDQKQTEELLIRQKEELSEFVHQIAHDSRNNLLSIQGYADLLLQNGETQNAPKIKSLVRRIQELHDRSVELADAGLVVEKQGNVNIQDIVVSVAETVIPENVSFSVTDLPAVFCDRQKVTQIFQNLFENALSHGKPYKIEVKGYNSEEGIKIIITNDGKRIPEENRTKIFQRGFTTKEKSNGLGMNIVQRIVEAHGWKISLVDTPNTTFAILIPILT